MVLWKVVLYELWQFSMSLIKKLKIHLCILSLLCKPHLGYSQLKIENNDTYIIKIHSLINNLCQFKVLSEWGSLCYGWVRDGRGRVG